MINFNRTKESQCSKDNCPSVNNCFNKLLKNCHAIFNESAWPASLHDPLQKNQQGVLIEQQQNGWIDVLLEKKEALNLPGQIKWN